MEFQDKNLICVDCGTEFLWTAGEQLFFADKNFKNEPKRCKGCKAKRAARPSGGGGGGGMARETVETPTNCSACGKETTVPFRPTQGRPVFCRECFQSRKFAGAGGVRLQRSRFHASVTACTRVTFASLCERCVKLDRFSAQT